MTKLKTRIAAMATASMLLWSVADQALSKAAGGEKPSVDRGRYIATIGHCGGCHNADGPGETPIARNHLAGRDIGFTTPDGAVVYARNLTPDPKYGLGKWSLEEIITAFRTGVRPDGRILQVMPWRDYGAMNDYDAMSLALYLKSLPPNPHDLPNITSIAGANGSYGLRVTANEGRRLFAERARVSTGHSH